MPKSKSKEDDNTQGNALLKRMSTAINQKLEENTFKMRETTFNMISIIKK